MPFDLSTLTAAQLDQLIAEASRLRAGMAPAHPMQAPLVQDWSYHTLTPMQVTPFHEADRRAAEAGFHLTLRSPGLGWCLATFEGPAAQRLFDQLQIEPGPKPPIQ